MEDLYSVFRPEILEAVKITVGLIFGLFVTVATIAANRFRAWLTVKELTEYRDLFDRVIENAKKRSESVTPDAIAEDLLAYAEETAPHIIAKLNTTRDKLKERMLAEGTQEAKHREASRKFQATNGGSF